MNGNQWTRRGPSKTFRCGRRRARERERKKIEEIKKENKPKPGRESKTTATAAEAGKRWIIKENNWILRDVPTKKE